MNKFFYNLSMFKTFLVLASLALITFSATAEMVPAAGSKWISELKYTGTGDTGKKYRLPETMSVLRHDNGVPVFATEVFGYKGEIVETSTGTVVLTEKCKDVVPKEIFTTPKNPNQCGWHLCTAPEEGKSFVREMIFFTEMYSCVPKVATYTFTSTSKSEINGQAVTVGDVVLDFGLFQKVKWESHIRQGVGEVFAKSKSGETHYSVVDVSLMPFAKIGNTESSNNAALKFAKKEEKTQCDVIAFGDSLTQGVGVAQNQNYPSVLSKMLGKDICNLGIAGNTTVDARDRLTQVLDLKPKMVFMGIGANDFLKGVAPETTQKNIGHMIDVFTKEGIMVVVLGFEGLKDGEKYKTALNLDSRNDIVYVPLAFAGVLDDAKMLSADNMHPNEIGYKKVAQNIYDEVFISLETLSGYALKN